MPGQTKPGPISLGFPFLAHRLLGCGLCISLHRGRVFFFVLKKFPVTVKNFCCGQKCYPSCLRSVMLCALQKLELWWDHFGAGSFLPSFYYGRAIWFSWLPLFPLFLRWQSTNYNKKSISNKPNTHDGGRNAKPTESDSTLLRFYYLSVCVCVCVCVCGFGGEFFNKK